MAIDATNKNRYESDIETAFLSPIGVYIKGTDILINEMDTVVR